MKRFLVILILLCFASVVYADVSRAKRYGGYPEGSFKKSRNGKIIQYDKNGKKVGVYNLKSGKSTKRK